MKRTFSVLLGILCVSSFIPVEAPAQETKPFFSKPIQFGAHRCGLRWRPESTLKTFQEAAARWPDLMIETDARVTKDGVAVFLHDKTVDRTTNGSGAIADLTWDEVKDLDAGYNWTLDKGATFPHRGQGYQLTKVADGLRALPDMHFLIEIKDQPGGAEAIVAAIQEARAEDRVMLASFNPKQIKIAKELAPEIAVCFDAATSIRLLGAYRGGKMDSYEPEADMLILNYNRIESYGITPEDLPKIQAFGIPVCVYTINDEQQIHEVLDLGIQSILTDKPDSLARILEKRGLR